MEKATKAKYAILTGSLFEGFGITRISDDKDSAEEIVINHMANGMLSESIEISLPSSMNEKEKDYQEGENFTVFSSGIGNGITIFGPFPDDETAEEFGEQYRSEDDEWSLFVFNPKESPSDRPRG